MNGMKRKGVMHSERLLFPMIITILVIAGFQAYWLYDNYSREKRSLAIKTNMAFRESVFELQAAKFKFNKRINSTDKDSSSVQVFITDHKQTEIHPDADAAEMVNVISDK